MKVRYSAIRKYYRCGMISLIFVPIIFYIELKIIEVYYPQYAIENKYLCDSDSSSWVNDHLFDYSSDYSRVIKRDTVRISRKIDKKKIATLFDLKSGNSLYFEFTDSSTYGNYIYIYNCALTNKLAIYNINNSALVVYNPIDNLICINPGHPDPPGSLDNDYGPYIRPTLWKRFADTFVYHFKQFRDYLNYIRSIGVFYKVMVLLLSFLMIVILNIIELKRLSIADKTNQG